MVSYILDICPRMLPAAGAGEKYVTKYLGDFPEHDHSQLKIGHILRLYNERSFARTIHAFAQRFNLRCTPHHMRRVTVGVLNRFKH